MGGGQGLEELSCEHGNYSSMEAEMLQPRWLRYAKAEPILIARTKTGAQSYEPIRMAPAGFGDRGRYDRRIPERWRKRRGFIRRKAMGFPPHISRDENGKSVKLCTCWKPTHHGPLTPEEMW